jgi:hypothetical protein
LLLDGRFQLALLFIQRDRRTIPQQGAAFLLAFFNARILFFNALMNRVCSDSYIECCLESFILSKWVDQQRLFYRAAALPRYFYRSRWGML